MVPDNTVSRPIPASPKIVSDFILELLQSGQPARRSELIVQVMRLAPTRGFVLEGGAAARTVKKSLSALAKAGRVCSPRVGWWKIADLVPGQGTTGDVQQPPAVSKAEVLQTPEQSPPPRLVVGRYIGEGPESVYVYYHESDAELARRDGRTRWECKIGWTSAVPDERVIGQGALTAFHRPPVIALVIRTHDGRTLEQAIHASLTLAGKRVKGRAGTEWFDTSPDEIERWFHSYAQTLSCFGESG